MVVSAVPAPAVDFTCNGNPVEQVATFKYLGLHFHQSGSIAQLLESSLQLKPGQVVLGRLFSGVIYIYRIRMTSMR